MFREMRLAAQQLSHEETIKILQEASHATLAINGDGPYPYSVPISFVYNDGKIYFHGAAAGQKFDLMMRDPHVCLSAITMDDVQAKGFTTYYRSAVVYGDITRLETMEEIAQAMMLTVDKYCEGDREGGTAFMNAEMGNFCVYCLDIKHMTGKRSEG